MSTRRYPLESGGPERLEITWSPGIQNRKKPCTITLDGNVLYTFPSGDIAQEHVYKLPDGSWLSLQFTRGLLVVKRNDALLPGSRQPIPQVAGQYALTFGMLGLVVLVIALVIGISSIVGSMPAAMNQYVEGALFILGGLLVASACFFIARGLARLRKWARIPAAIVVGAIEVFLLIGLLLSGNPIILIAMILDAIPLFQLFTAKEFTNPPPSTV
jgi:hypothetical protein